MGELAVDDHALDVDLLVSIVRELASLPGGTGRERARADRLAELLAPRAHEAGIDLAVRPFDGGARANVVLGPRTGADLALVGHLDASLGDDPDEWGRITGRGDDPGPVRVVDGALEGRGVGVALAPSVAAALTAIALHRHEVGRGRVGALLCAGGTHRATPPTPRAEREAAPSAAGLRVLADEGALPGAAINAKGGAPGPLAAEPGSCYLTIELADTWGPVLARPAGAPLAGPAAHLGAVIDVIDAWRRDLIAERAARDDVLGADVAIGALDAGLPAKPDLLPATARVHLHVVTAPGDDATALAGSLLDALRAAPRLTRLAHAITVVPYGELPAGRTDPAHPLVQAADAAWRAVLGDHDVRAWRGATDGAYLRHMGIPTVRIGPPLASAPDDARRERVRLDDLRRTAEVWTRTAATYLAAGGSR